MRTRISSSHPTTPRATPLHSSPLDPALTLSIPPSQQVKKPRIMRTRVPDGPAESEPSTPLEKPADPSPAESAVAVMVRVKRVRMSFEGEDARLALERQGGAQVVSAW